MPLDGGGGRLAYSAPFRVLSDAGVEALRAVIDDNTCHATYVPGRIPKCLRGVGYRSQFIRDLGFCPEVLAHLSACAGEPVTPHGMASNLSQTNFGEVGGRGKVDQWHLDSVPYVMVLLMSDARDMVGGELLVAQIPGDPKEALTAVQRDAVDARFVDVVNYPGPGYAIFMQGSRIAHAVTPVQHARETRITVVNSYQSCNAFAPDSTVYRTFRTMADKEGTDVAPFEFARHAAWRVAGQLDFVMNKANYFGSDKRDALAAVLENAAQELMRAKALISDELQEDAPYNVEEEKLKDVQERASALLQ